MTSNAHDRLVGSYLNRELNEARLQRAREIADGPVLDIGCGDGVYLDALPYDAIGIDILEYSNRSRIVRGDAQALPFKDDSFHTVLLFEVLEHLESPQDCLHEIKRVVTDSLLLSVPNAVDPDIFEKSGVAMHPFVDPTHINHYDENGIRAELQEAGYVNIRVEFINMIKPMKLVLHMLGMGQRPAAKLGHYFHRLICHLPWCRSYYMTMLVSAEVDT